MEYEVGQSRDVVGYAAGGTTEDFAYLPEPQGIILKKIENKSWSLPPTLSEGKRESLSLTLSLFKENILQLSSVKM